MWEDLGFSAPTNVIIPSGAGSNILGCDIGFSEVSSRHVASHQLAQGHANLGGKRLCLKTTLESQAPLSLLLADRLPC